MMTNKFDELLTQLGTGKWNLIYFISAGYWCFLLPPQTFNMMFYAPAVNYTCLPPEGENITHISEDSCTYTVDRSSLAGLEEKHCTEWDFDTSVFTRTLTSEFGLVCQNAYLRASYQSIYAFSTIFSPFISGYIADRHGRKVVVVVSLVVYSFTSLGTSVITNFSVILAFRFILGTFANPTIYILSMEVCEVRMRSVVGVLLGLPWAVSMMAWGALAYLIRDWRWLQFTVSLPMLLIMGLLFLIDESPRWLIVKGRHEQALKVLRRVARLNKSTLPPEEELRLMMSGIQAEAEMSKRVSRGKDKEALGKKKKRCSFRTPALLSTSNIRLIMSVLSLNVFTCNLVYCGLSLSGNIYSSNPFIYVVIGGLMEVPGYTLTSPIIAHWGRKMPIMIGLYICGAALLSLAFIPSDISWLVMTLAMIGKLAISGVFMMVIVYETELLPTEVRLQGAAVNGMMGQLANTISPYVIDVLGPIVSWLPSMIFGVSSFLSALSLLTLPETRLMAMPDTINDLEDVFSKKKKIGEGDKKEMEKLQI
ncbi:organic cation transporter protein-like [Homarus americanus]|uniref:organic cation transporter protein-like n=1 Tax=Homarus americanus TaxID=6706 RepID=UPI001C461140|nr:organic cation transporter protein-like [Homarus americanus]